MKKTIKTLIIEDHQLIIDSYKNAILSIQDNYNINFIIEDAKNCNSALEKVQSQSYLDLIFLDIRLPHFNKGHIYSGEQLGVEIRKLHPKAKIIVCTGLTDNYRLNHILKTINPEGFMIKEDITLNDIINCVQSILNEGIFYSQKVLSLIRKKITHPHTLDDLDIRILHEISNGSKMKDLIDLIPLSKAGIEKRKRALKKILNHENDNDRGLVTAARKIGFI